MKPYEATEILEAAWAEPEGVLFQLRQGNLDADRLRELVAVIRVIEVDDHTTSLPRRLVSLLWYLPIFIDWQKQRVEQSGGSAEAVEQFATEVTNELERVLGIP